MAHILVTGAAGFIGSHTVDRLLHAGHEVTGVDNFRTGRRENLASAQSQADFRLVEMDVSNPGALDDLVGQTRPDALVHLAALVSVPESIANPDLNHALNVSATHLVAETARRYGVRRIVFASSAAVYGDVTEQPIPESAPKAPLSPYGAAKLASEALLTGHATAYGLTVRCHRYFNVFGPRQDPSSTYSGAISVFLRRLTEGREITIFGDGRQTRDFISVHDVARANVIAATRSDIPSGIANICTGRATSLLEVVEFLRREFPSSPAPRHEAPRAADIRHSLGAPGVAAAELGFRAEVPLEEGLSELAREAAGLGATTTLTGG